MMIENGNQQVAAFCAFLAKLGVPSKDCALAGRCLKGEVGEEAFDSFESMNFQSLYPTGFVGGYEALRRDLIELMKGLDNTKERQMCIRFFQVLFAIGHSTCHVLLPYTVIDKLLHIGECALFQILIVYMEEAREHCGYLRKQHIEYLVQVARSDIGRFTKSIDHLKKEGSFYFLSAAAAYFCARYGIVKPLKAEDTALMKAYEETLLGCLDKWLEQQYCSGHRRIVTTIREHQLDKSLIKNLIKTTQFRFGIPERRQLCFIAAMAYVNFPLSDVLLDVVRTCLAIDAEWSLFTFADVSVGTLDTSRRISTKGGDYDELFWIDPETYIRWAAVMEYERILKRQLAKNQEIYLKAMEESGFQVLIAKKNQTALYHSDSARKAVHFLKDVLKKENPTLYEQSGAHKPDYEQIIDFLVKDMPHADVAREYLRGNCHISMLYPYAQEFQGGYVADMYLEGEKRYCSSDQDFFDRCKAFLVLAGSEYTLVSAQETDKLRGVENFFGALDRQQMDIANQLAGFVTAYKSYDGMRGCSLNKLVQGAVRVFARYLDKRREETVAAFAGAKAEGRYLALLVMREDAARYQEEILSYASDSAKLVRDELLDILYTQAPRGSLSVYADGCPARGAGEKEPDWFEAVKSLLAAKKAAQRELAVLVLTHWQQECGNMDYTKLLQQALEKEKNARVLKLLQEALNIRENFSKTLSTKELIKQLHKGNKKKSLAWAYDKPFPTVHRTDGGEASEEYLQAVLLSYAIQDKCGISRNAKLLAMELDDAEFARYTNELFDRWLATGADFKRRWVLCAASIHGGEDIVSKLQHQIREWPQQARGAIAVEAVKALALSPSPRALLFVDTIARKFKFRQVKEAAAEALSFAAAELGITSEELSDRIVPDLGFDEKMQRTFDYGERTFSVVLTPSLEMQVYDGSGKRLKRLPAPGKKDDADKAAKAYAAFQEMKKQMKVAVTSQKARLEYALSVKREWSADAWKALFVKNPLMHQFAIGLIWGVYEGSRLIQSFRYMEDGSFNTQDGEEYELPGDAHISLVHPLELADGELAAWKEQLADYEIIQPIAQLDREIYVVTQQEADSKCLERFDGCIVDNLSLNTKLTGLGWYRGSVQDGGGFYTYYREDEALGIGVELNFSGTYIGASGEDVTIHDARFYKASTVAHGSYEYDKVAADKAFALKDVPPRYFSEIVLQLTRAKCDKNPDNN